MSGYQTILKAKTEAEGLWEALIRRKDKSKNLDILKMVTQKGVHIRADGQFVSGVPVETPVE